VSLADGAAPGFAALWVSYRGTCAPV